MEFNDDESVEKVGEVFVGFSISILFYSVF